MACNPFKLAKAISEKSRARRLLVRIESLGDHDDRVETNWIGARATDNDAWELDD